MRSGAHSAGLGCRILNNSSLAAAGLTLFWVFLFLSQLRLCHSMDVDTNKHHHLKQLHHLKSGHDQLSVKFAPRKLLTVAQQHVSGISKAAAASSPPSLPPHKHQSLNAENGDGSEVVYEDDKRRVHTGPNPLHN